MEMTQSTKFFSTDENTTLASTISENLENFFASSHTTSDEEVSILALWCGF